MYYWERTVYEKAPVGEKWYNSSCHAIMLALAHLRNDTQYQQQELYITEETIAKMIRSSSSTVERYIPKLKKNNLISYTTAKIKNEATGEIKKKNINYDIKLPLITPPELKNRNSLKIGDYSIANEEIHEIKGHTETSSSYKKSEFSHRTLDDYWNQVIIKYRLGSLSNAELETAKFSFIQNLRSLQEKEVVALVNSALQYADYSDEQDEESTRARLKAIIKATEVHKPNS